MAMERNSSCVYKSFNQTILPFVLLGVFASCYHPSGVYAFQDILPRSARALGTGATLAASPYDPASRLANPAAGTWIKDWGATIQYARQWGLPELDRFQGSVLGRRGPWVGGLQAIGFGKGVYEERTAGASISRQWQGSYSVGAALNLQHLHIDEYMDEWGLGAAFGVLVHGKPGAAAVVVENIATTGLTGDHVRPNLRFRLAGKKPLLKRLHLHMEWEIEEHLSGTVRIGLESQLPNGIRLSAGYADASGRFFVGLGFLYRSLRVDAGNDYHPDLGWSHAYGITRTGPADPDTAP
ncbi:hypothetical protein GF324_06235 [bacterium]|nr:hypothetical protein [bacterium]